ncbi:hypothetical protein ABGT15_14265 [Flavobacterium enshiense]|uniref:hypothetical protein n=1 Tax=Flavobacterium enshiense TaxID=1341165 RepID=UPI00345D9AA9
MKNFYLLTVLLFAFFGKAQQKAISFEEAKKTSHSAEVLDKAYKSALHSDAKLAVFKTEQEQEQLVKAYTKLLQDFGTFLKQHNFSWQHTRRCFNRIYINKTGDIDYFLYQFNSNKEHSEENMTPIQVKEFERLLNLFLQDYRFGVSANENFAQCSPVVYKD